jgi:hypothetical protein
MRLVVDRSDDVEARAVADHQHEQHLERLVDEANQLDKVELHEQSPRCAARFTSWFGEVFCCVEPCGHGYAHRTAATPEGDVWTWTSDAHPRADDLTNLAQQVDEGHQEVAEFHSPNFPRFPRRSSASPALTSCSWIPVGVLVPRRRRRLRRPFAAFLPGTGTPERRADRRADFSTHEVADHGDETLLLLLGRTLAP